VIKYAVAGSLNYSVKIDYLVSNGYQPELVIGPENIADYEAIIKDKKIELLVCFAYPNILKKKELELFSKGCINYHSGLPKYRGRHPLNWMLIDGMKTIPNAIHYMDEGIDTGDILLQRNIVSERGDDYKTILHKQTLISQEMMLEAIKMIESGGVTRIRQNPDELGYTPKRKPEDSRMNWKSTSKQLHNFISALVDPMPNAFCYTEDKKISIRKSYIGPAPGIILYEIEDRKYVVSTGDGVVVVETDIKLNVGNKLQ